jgi:hypothetical protein
VLVGVANDTICHLCAHVSLSVHCCTFAPLSVDALLTSNAFPLCFAKSL